EDDVGSGLCQYLHQIRPNDSPIPAILGGAVSGSSRVDINKTADGEAGDGGHGVKPGTADTAAPDENSR
ncbi:MAG: hypothetical protein KDD91_16485, partial [Caldilinea sp.]|nr:hypothetical protein [Caldilinea sp.]